MSKKLVIVVLPVEGSPYIWKNAHFSKKEIFPEMKEVQDGYIERANADFVKIHPMFQEEDKRWEIAEKLLRTKKAEVYCDEDGMYKKTPNMGVALCYREELRPMFGNICIVISVSNLKKVCEIEVLSLVKIYDKEDKDCEYGEYKWMYKYDINNGEQSEMKEIVRKAKREGWEFKEGLQAFYLKKV